MSYKLADAASKTGLPRQARALLEAICRQVHRPGQEWQVCHKELAERMGYTSTKTVQRWLPKLDGYIVRREIYRDAHYYCVLDPAQWPANPTAATVNLDKKSSMDKKSGQTGQDVQGITVLNPLEVTDVTSLSPAGDAVASLESKVICLDSRRPKAEPADVVTVRYIVESFNRQCAVHPKKKDRQPHHLTWVKEITDKRTAAIRARIKGCPERRTAAYWDALWSGVAASDFLTGRARDFQATFDWILCPTNFAKVDEGNYENKSAAPATVPARPVAVAPPRPLQGSLRVRS